jgi:copper chaperone CopZ
MRNRRLRFLFVLAALACIFLIGSTIAAASDLEKVTLKVEGMECKACVKTVRKALLKVPGVKAAEVRLVDKEAMVGEAKIEYEKDKTTPQQLIGAVDAASNPMITYKASIIGP